MTKIKALLLTVSFLAFGLSGTLSAQNCPLNLKHIKMKTPCDMTVVSSANGHYEAYDNDITLIIDYLGVDQLKNIKTHFNKIADEKKLPKSDYNEDNMDKEVSTYNNTQRLTYQASDENKGVYYIAAADVKDASDVTYAIVIIYNSAKQQLGTNMANSLKYIE